MSFLVLIIAAAGLVVVGGALFLIFWLSGKENKDE